MAGVMVQVSWIEKSHQHIDIGQIRLHHSSRKRLTSSSVIGLLPAGRFSKRMPFRLGTLGRDWSARRNKSEMTLSVR